jgi:hypothetical protein
MCAVAMPSLSLSWHSSRWLPCRPSRSFGASSRTRAGLITNTMSFRELYGAAGMALALRRDGTWATGSRTLTWCASSIWWASKSPRDSCIRASTSLAYSQEPSSWAQKVSDLQSSLCKTTILMFDLYRPPAQPSYHHHCSLCASQLPWQHGIRLQLVLRDNPLHPLDATQR